MRRRRMSRGASRRNFQANSGTHRRNFVFVMRGGYRI